MFCFLSCFVSSGDTITLEELDLLSQVPNYVPVCAGKEWSAKEGGAGERGGSRGYIEFWEDFYLLISFFCDLNIS